MKGIILLLGMFVSLSSNAQVHWLEAKENMSCNTEDATVSHLANYLIKNKFAEGIDAFFDVIGVRYYKDSVLLEQVEVSATDTLKEFYVTGEAFTKKGSLIRITDKKSSSEDSALLVKLSTRETERFEYDSEGIPVLRTWNCTVTVFSADLILNFLNQSQNDFLIGNTKIKVNETYKFEKVEKL